MPSLSHVDASNISVSLFFTTRLFLFFRTVVVTIATTTPTIVRKLIYISFSFLDTVLSHHPLLVVGETVYVIPFDQCKLHLFVRLAANTLVSKRCRYIE